LRLLVIDGLLKAARVCSESHDPRAGVMLEAAYGQDAAHLGEGRVGT
jgi:hypothetical protein